MQLDHNKENSVIILAGGVSRRFNNKIKALEVYNAMSLLGHRIILSNKIFSKIIVSLSSDEIKLRCQNQLRKENIDLSNVSFIIDKEKDKGPMKALINIIPHIKTKYCGVIGVDNLLIRNIDFQNLQEKLMISDASLITVLVNKTRLVASFFVFDVNKITVLLTTNQFINNFERITDIFRIVPLLAFLKVSEKGQYLNINTPEELQSIDIKKVKFLEAKHFFMIKPNHFRFAGISCDSFTQELQCWFIPDRIEHVVNNILNDARKELKDDFVRCNFSKYVD